MAAKGGITRRTRGWSGAGEVGMAALGMRRVGVVVVAPDRVTMVAQRSLGFADVAAGPPAVGRGGRAARRAGN